MSEARGIPSTVSALRSRFDSGRTKPLAWRLAQLRALDDLLAENGSALESALAIDLGKPGTESQLTEIGFVRAELAHTLANLTSWLRPERVAVPLALQPATASVVPEPLGVVLIIGPWNYPVQLILGPLIGALAAGNAVVLKPSELAPASSAALARLVPRYLDREAVAVIEGGVPETTALLTERFDHIFYTGSGRVGRIVLAASVTHLTPVTLELGGKSPVYVDDTVDLAATAKRIAWGKFLNAGQTCVAPDYLLATADVARRLEPHLTAAIASLYGGDPRSSSGYGRIVSDSQLERLTGLLTETVSAGAGIVTGGDSDAAERYLAPTVVRDVPRESPLMEGEIFGPILPIVTVDGLDDAIGFINSGDKPLALYVFTESDRTRRRILTETSSGAVGFNVPVAHLSVPGLPFGGVGGSGSGSYHGRRSFTTFSHEKAVLSKPLVPDTLALIYAPFTPRKESFIRGLLRRLS